MLTQHDSCRLQATASGAKGPGGHQLSWEEVQEQPLL